VGLYSSCPKYRWALIYRRRVRRPNVKMLSTPLPLLFEMNITQSCIFAYWYHNFINVKYDSELMDIPMPFRYSCHTLASLTSWSICFITKTTKFHYDVILVCYIQPVHEFQYDVLHVCRTLWRHAYITYSLCTCSRLTSNLFAVQSVHVFQYDVISACRTAPARVPVWRHICMPYSTCTSSSMTSYLHAVQHLHEF